MYKLAYNSILEFKGFYSNDVHDYIPEPNVDVTQELWSHLLSIGKFKMNDIPKKAILDMDDINIFEIITECDPVPPTQVDMLEEQNANLIKDSLQKDIKIKDLNMSLAQTTLNLINKDIEVKSLNSNLSKTTLNLVSKDIEVKDMQKDISNLILQSLGGK